MRLVRSDKTITQLVSERALEDGKKKALDYFGFSLTWSNIDGGSSSFAHALKEMGVKKGDRVILSLPPSPQFLISFLGIVKAGGIPFLVDPEIDGGKLNVILKEAKASYAVLSFDKVGDKQLCGAFQGLNSPELSKMVLIVSGLLDLLPPVQQLTVASNMRISSQKVKEAKNWYILLDENLGKEADTYTLSQDICAVQYTQGRSGKPKGVVLTHENLVASALQLSDVFKLTKSDVVFGAYPVTHVWGLMTTFGASLVTGASMTYLPLYDPLEAGKTVARANVTVFTGTPRMVEEYMTEENSKRKTSSLRLFVTFGAPILKKTSDSLLAFLGQDPRSLKVMNLFGLTESSGFLSACECSSDYAPNLGVPLRGTDLHVLDPEDLDREVKRGIGLLCAQGPQISPGYLRGSGTNPFYQGYVVTDDLVRVHENGAVSYVCRLDEASAYQGELWPFEARSLLLEHTGVKDVSISPLAGDTAAGGVKVLVLPQSNSSLTEKELLEYYNSKRKTLPEITSISVVDKL